MSHCFTRQGEIKLESLIRIYPRIRCLTTRQRSVKDLPRSRGGRNFL